MTVPETAPAPRGGPRTPEGKARAAQNARKHGLRARDFGLAPDEDPHDWGLHVQVCEEGYGPEDAHERGLVHAIAAAMWNEIRADRMMAEVMARIPPAAAGHSFGNDTAEPGQALSLGTAIRYQTAAGMAMQRAQRAFFAYRTAKLRGLIVPRPAVPAPANANFTNELRPGTSEPGPAPAEPSKRTNEPAGSVLALPAPIRLPVPEPLAALRARLERLLQHGAAGSPGDQDLLAAIRARKLPGAAPYRGPIDPPLLDRVLAERGFDIAGLAWLQGFGRPPPDPTGA